MRRRDGIILLGLTALGGCARHAVPVAVASPPPAAVVAPQMPAGARPGMIIPARLADGGYDTPNRALTPAAATWHLRAALNVAALACRGPDDALLVQRYNAVLSSQRTVLKSAEAALATEYRLRGGGDWRNGYDMSMTRLYNYFSQDFARTAFCASAMDVLGAAQSVAPADFPTFAAQRLPELDRAFTDFFRAYDGWRMATGLIPVTPGAPIVLASVAPVTEPAPPVALADNAPVRPVAVAALRSPPRIALEIDPRTLDIR